MGGTPYTFEGYSYMIAGGKFKAKPREMFFWCTTNVFMGHVMTRQGSYHDPKKV
jgi:hypothetical protein